MGDHRPAYDRFVTELALQPDMIYRLLAWHPAVGDCDACRLPGAQIAITAPCSIRLLAERARSVASARAGAS
jgi:hypothetical protein